ncbi:hypothetical protein GCM10007853_06670 [Algimonas ampicilliniresistens]|uniref:DUF2946 domain-containing protein n=1 Tax=Algimonas ampicilliniresistens TaxID=1298735 RepID=A0ABQ5V7G7_9PROT|nr:hypothetical protein [Algimonas ampicilliniresistens]GLQ22793.1 hypothetical protein GCM10007853_06670 [Algimonas ampicilliniresistens]
MMVRPHILRLLTAFAVLLQLALPYAQANAAANGTDLSDLICNPSGRAASAEAKAALSELLSIVGEEEESDAPPDCERCVSPNVTVVSASVTVSAPVQFGRLTHRHPASEALGPISPRGPPCGTRAPPPFV